MLTHNTSYPMDDTSGGNPRANRDAALPTFAFIPPTPFAGYDRDDNDREACRLVAVHLAAYLDSELDPDQMDLVTEHLDACGSCRDKMEAIETTDEMILREWRDSAPLPSSSQFRSAVDSIMDALPPAPDVPVQFAPKRVHSRARWIRFAAGMSGVLLIGVLLWSSYQLGYTHAQQRVLRQSTGPRTGLRRLPTPCLPLALSAFKSPLPAGPDGLMGSAERLAL